MTGIHFKRINSTFEVSCNDFSKDYQIKKMFNKKTKVKLVFKVKHQNKNQNYLYSFVETQCIMNGGSITRR